MLVFHAGLNLGTELRAPVLGWEVPGRGWWVAGGGHGAGSARTHSCAASVARLRESSCHRQPFSAAPGKRAALKQWSLALKGWEINRGCFAFLHVVSIFQIHAVFGIGQSSDFNGCLQTGSLEYFDLFGYWADLQPAVLTVVVVF